MTARGRECLTSYSFQAQNGPIFYTNGRPVKFAFEKHVTSGQRRVSTKKIEVGLVIRLFFDPLLTVNRTLVEQLFETGERQIRSLYPRSV